MDTGTRRITGTWLVGDEGVIERGDFLINSDGTVSESKGDEDVVESIDGSMRMLTRSFQNWHTHLSMVLNKSMGEGLPLMEWLETSIFPVEKGLTAEFVEVGTKAAAAEMIATGTTFACDMYYHPDVVGNVLSECGLRAKVCGPITDFPTPSYPEGAGQALSKIEGLISEGTRSPNRVEFGIGTHSVYACSEETLRKASEISRETGCTLSIHTSETREEVADCHSDHGMYPIEYLDSIDYFTDGTVCAHCGWVTKKEMRILSGHGAHAVHCPTSNQKLACGGTMSYPAMREAGVDVRLGTDGAASNNSLDMRAEAKAASLVQRHDHWNARILGPLETWQLATRGSRDWVTWDLNDVRMRPWGRFGRRLLPNLIYSGGRVLDMFVDGEALRRDGVTLSIDEEDVASQLEVAVESYYEEL
ncbi:MAG: amidohydrolase family protein [Candidatus Thalassarchaeaceae archaeon]|jgi:5-methylthioadenosine/S-adenosylhomocysteine deaminase|nr:amidohydrolase family protein [Candidatus Thalassarchaeaceae archaeon]